MSDTSEVLTITLDPAVWYRGKGGSKLLGFDEKTGARQQCCLGIAATACGVPDDVLLNMGELQRSRVVAALPADGPLLALVTTARFDANPALTNVYTENDVDFGTADDAERVEAINEHVAPFGLRFVLGSLD
jgi:hypothetical protein